MQFPSRQRRTPAQPIPRRSRAGLTLVEILCALAVLMIGLLGFTQAIFASSRSSQATKENTLATQAARRVLEEIQANVFDELFWRYNALASDDPGGSGTAAGANFAVTGLQATADDADGFPGEVIMPVVAGVPGVLRENISDGKLGMPRDLNGDGAIDGLNHATDYEILPVLVRVRWRGPGGVQTVELRTMLGNY